MQKQTHTQQFQYKMQRFFFFFIAAIFSYIHFILIYITISQSIENLKMPIQEIFLIFKPLDFKLVPSTSCLRMRNVRIRRQEVLGTSLLRLRLTFFDWDYFL